MALIACNSLFGGIPFESVEAEEEALHGELGSGQNPVSDAADVFCGILVIFRSKRNAIQIPERFSAFLHT